MLNIRIVFFRLRLNTMPIKFSNMANSISSRTNSYFKAFQLIIDYSEANKDITERTTYLINEAYRDFLLIDAPTLQDLEVFTVKAITILNSFYLSCGVKSNLEFARKSISEADHIYNWIFRSRKKIQPVLLYGDSTNNYEPKLKKGFLQVMEQIPMRSFTKEMTEEWIKILDEEKPEWFKQLPEWQRAIFTDFVSFWVDREKFADPNYKPYYFTKMPPKIQSHFEMLISLHLKKKTLKEINLGVIIGLQPGAESKYPSNRNAYKTKLCNYMHSETNGVALLKKATMIRMAIPAVINSSPKEQERLTKMCIEQAILYEIVNQYKVGLVLSGMKRKLVFPVLFQTLASNHRSLNDDVMMAAFIPAFEKAKSKFTNNEYCHKFLNDNAEFLKEAVNRNSCIKNPEKFLKVILSKGVITFSLYHIHHNYVSEKSPLNYSSTSRDEIIKTLESHYSTAMLYGIKVNGTTINKHKDLSKVKKHILNNNPSKALEELDNLSDDATVKYKIATLRMGLDALGRYKTYNNLKYKIYRKFDKKVSLEAASYLQIAFSSIGIRIGGGPNGCDIESPLSIFVNSLRIFHNAMGYFPQTLSSNRRKSYKEERNLLNLKAAEQFLAGYCQEILERSAQGCYGVTFLDKTLGCDVLKQIEFLLKKYGLLIDSKFLYDTNHEISKLENIANVLKIEEHKELVKETKDAFAKADIQQYQGTKFTAHDIRNDISYNFRNDESVFLLRIYRSFSIKSMDDLMKAIAKEQYATPAFASTVKKLSKFSSKFKNSDIMKTRISDINEKKAPMTYDEKINSFIAKAEADSHDKLER